METLPNEIVLNEILKAMDQRTALNFLMSNTKYRGLVSQNINRYFPSEKYYKPQKQAVNDEIIYGREVDMDKVVINDAIINIKKFVMQKQMSIPDVIYYAELLDNPSLLDDYKNFIGIYGVRYSRHDYSNVENPETNNIYLDRDRNSLHNYEVLKLKDKNYDKSLRILRTLIYNMEEKILIKGNGGGTDNYVTMISDFSVAGYNDVVKFIVDNIYMVDVGRYVIDNGSNNIDLSKYIIDKYIKDGGLLQSLGNNILIGAIDGDVDMGYIPLFSYLLSIKEIPYDFQQLYNDIESNVEVTDENVKIELLKIVESYL
ncbi:Hypothetical protein ORPV_252 [Orpheovirus IHUMI-LCC2]|uniref:Uncharacterized protein n=1 Tax=Orpheovirus IHUMI-LCC2 TaxID=2023057 RepID=A0A2I2L3P4_9VIRU|nr:Hypothetical protein ORPV_252 [Orpheovirus IHUMI-LCC2]SNW62156.1 Hypothetical protein ORPV_252 [Orpheovirus IHUMI-LCC2]